VKFAAKWLKAIAHWFTPNRPNVRNDLKIAKATNRMRLVAFS
jgi:hypothetical protein